eukprot:7306107-Pyramimonas_sp.AAC.1
MRRSSCRSTASLSWSLNMSGDNNTTENSWPWSATRVAKFLAVQPRRRREYRRAETGPATDRQ